MHDQRTILIVGRGPSAFEHDWSSLDSHVMAVSSGIFAIPEGVVPQHFVAMDQASYFNSPINEHAIAWQNDPRARVWPFWSYASIVKHINIANNEPGEYRPFPMTRVMEAMGAARNPERVRAALLENFEWIQSHYGHIPNWGDYSNVRPWRVVIAEPPNFADLDAPVGCGGMRNSVFMAVQIAARLGYRDMRFVGIFDGEGYEQHREVLAQWHTQALNQGIRWTSLGHAYLFSQQMEHAA